MTKAAPPSSLGPSDRVPPRSSTNRRQSGSPSPVPSPGGFVVKRESFDDKTVAHMSFMTPSDAARENADMIDAVGNSFRRMSPQEIADFNLKRFHVVKVSPDDNLGSLAEKMAFDDYQLARFKTLNAIETQDQLQKARRVKLVTLGD